MTRPAGAPYRVSMRWTVRNLVCIALPVVACSAFAARAGEIYKCVADGATSYQSMPCERGQAQARMSIIGNGTPARDATVAAARQPPAQRTLGPGPWRHQALALGVSDDEVLNMPEWGRPNRIVRTKLARGWLEVWTYGNPAVGERELAFTNARLTDIGGGAPSQVALSTR